MLQSKEHAVFRYEYNQVVLEGYYAPYEPIKGRHIAYVTYIHIYGLDPNGHLDIEAALQGLEGLTLLDEYWGVLLTPVDSHVYKPEIVPVLQRRKYKQLPHGWYMPVRGISVQVPQLNDLLEYHKRKIREELELGSETRI